MRTIKNLLEEHPFFEGLKPEYMEIISGCGTNVVFNAGEEIFREGESADHFFVIRHGKIAVEIRSPSRGSLCVQTLGDGDVLGWSWLVPPYRWHGDARALTLVRAVALDAECLRRKCEEDPVLGYDLSKRFSHVMVERLKATQMQLLDLYGVHS